MVADERGARAMGLTWAWQRIAAQIALRTLIFCWFLSLSWLEAKKRNPNIKLYGLAWAFPSWVGNSSGDPFKFPELTARYLVEWVAGAKSEYGTLCGSIAGTGAHLAGWRNVMECVSVSSWAV